MTIWWCRGCGMEDTRAHNACPSCGSAMLTSDVAWLNDGDVAEETVYELETTPTERAAVVEALLNENISHRWDNPEDLVVAQANEPAVDSIIDDVLGGELEEVPASVLPFGVGGLEAAHLVGDVPGTEGVDLSDLDGDGVNDDEEGDDDGYNVMSNLFMTTGRLLKRWEDDDVSTFLDQSGTLLVTKPPFGVDEEVWADIQSLTRNTATSLQDDKEADVEPQLKELQEKLHLLV